MNIMFTFPEEADIIKLSSSGDKSIKSPQGLIGRSCLILRWLFFWVLCQIPEVTSIKQTKSPPKILYAEKAKAVRLSTKN